MLVNITNTLRVKAILIAYRKKVLAVLCSEIFALVAVRREFETRNKFFSVTTYFKYLYHSKENGGNDFPNGLYALSIFS